MHLQALNTAKLALAICCNVVSISTSGWHGGHLFCGAAQGPEAHATGALLTASICLLLVALLLSIITLTVRNTPTIAHLVSLVTLYLGALADLLAVLLYHGAVDPHSWSVPVATLGAFLATPAAILTAVFSRLRLTGTRDP